MKLSKQSKFEYLLGLLQEESAEIIQITNKCKRFGLYDKYPADNFNNLTRLQNEVKDLLTIVGLLEGLYNIDLGLQSFDEEYTERKVEKIEKFMKYSENVGLLEGE